MDTSTIGFIVILFFYAVIGLGGVWVSLFAWQYQGPPVLPIGDPYVPEALASHGAQ